MVRFLSERRLCVCVCVCVCVCDWCYLYTTFVINNYLTFCKKLSLNCVNFL
jgi:hypothetical protein